jgi:hypothetical protein
LVLEEKFSMLVLQRQSPNTLPCFFNKHLSLAFLLLTAVLTISIGQATKASFEEAEQTTNRHRSYHDPKYYFDKEGNYDAEDIKAILTLLSNNPQFKYDVYTEIMKSDFYVVKAYFNHNPKDFLEKEIEFIKSKKDVLNQTQTCSSILFEVTEGIQQTQYNLILAVENNSQNNETNYHIAKGRKMMIIRQRNGFGMTKDSREGKDTSQSSPLASPDNGKRRRAISFINNHSKSNGKKEIPTSHAKCTKGKEKEEEEKEATSPTRNRAYIIFKSKFNSLTKTSPPTPSKRERKEGLNGSNIQPQNTPPSPVAGRPRATTSSSFLKKKSNFQGQDKPSQEIAFPPVKKKNKTGNLVRSLSSRFNQDRNKQKISSSSAAKGNMKRRNDTSPPELRKSKSFPNLKRDMPIQTGSVKRKIEIFEKFSSN